MKLTQKLAINFLRIKFSVLTKLSTKKAAAKAFELFCTPQIKHRRAIPQLFDTAEKIEFEFDLIMVRGYRWNHPSERKVLIIHGFDSTAMNFQYYIQKLSEKGFEVLAFDAPAHGLSGGKIITAPIYRDMIMHIMSRFGPIENFVAHSMGGLAIMLALEQTAHDHTAKIALIAPLTESITALDNFFKFLRIDDKKVRLLFEEMTEKITGHPFSWFSITRIIPVIRAKVLWIHDDEDSITPLADTFRIQSQNYSNVNFVITHGLGHRAIYRNKKVVNSVVDFITN